MNQLRLLLPLTAALALTGCLSFGADPPDQLMTLSASSALPAQSTARSATPSEAITVVEPTVARELSTVRVPVRTGSTALAYVKDAQWVELPSALFTRLLSEAISATTGRVVLDARQFTFDPGLRLTGQLHAFGVDADRMEVVATYDGVLARAADRVETRRFEARVPISAVDAASIAPALNQAANQVAADVARWVAG